MFETKMKEPGELGEMIMSLIRQRFCTQSCAGFEGCGGNCFNLEQTTVEIMRLVEADKLETIRNTAKGVITAMCKLGKLRIEMADVDPMTNQVIDELKKLMGKE